MRRWLRAQTNATFRCLRARNIRLFFAGQGTSQVGTWLQLLASSILALRLTDSGVALGFVGATQFGPTLLLGAWAGVLSDRVDRHRWLLKLQFAGAACSGVLATFVLSGQITLAWLYGLSLASGIVAALESPTRRAFVVDLVADEDAPNAIALNAALMTAARVVGPLLAGALISGPGIGWCFALNAASFAPQVVLLRRMDRAGFRESVRIARGRGQLRAGLRHVWDVPALRTTIAVAALTGTFAWNWTVVLPLLAERTLGGDERTFTSLFALMSAGSVIGSLAVARRRNVTVRFIGVSTLLMGIAMVALAVAPSIPIALALTVPLGVATVFVMAGANTLLQLRSAPEMRGRTLALLSVVFIGSQPIGAPFAGWISEAFGARAGLLMGAVSCGAAGGLALGVARSEKLPAIDIEGVADPAVAVP